MTTGLRAGDEPVVVAVHGGAGGLAPSELSPRRQAERYEALSQALAAGHAIVSRGGSSLDAVEAAVVVLEDAPGFNAGRGAKFNADAAHELDASIMDGEGLDGGAVTGVRHVRNPVRLARLVMERSPHVLLAGEGADAFATAQGIEPVGQDYFWNKRRWKALRKAKARAEETEDGEAEKADAARYETVGAVALDDSGHLAAATSTGGQTNQLRGRVGDSPILGAGTWAKDGVVAVSATGKGELFIRLAVAHEVAARMEHGGLDVRSAARAVVSGDLVERFGPGSGGLIALDGAGRVAMPFNTRALQRGWATRSGVMEVRLFGAE